MFSKSLTVECFAALRRLVLVTSSTAHRASTPILSHRFSHNTNRCQQAVQARAFSHSRTFQASANSKSKSKSKSQSQSPAKSSPSNKKSITLSAFISVANLANQLNIRYTSLVKALKDLGFDDSQVGHDYILDNETASLVAEEFNYRVTNSQSQSDAKYDVFKSPPCLDPKRLKPRPPIVTIMGHVDHGKTTILDHLRKSSIVKGEFGGITQHIGAFSVKTPVSQKLITFLDTPGHAAFLKMRERGANVTDIVVLVVAADDSVKPQTIEAIKHCQKYNTNVIIAINKCDKPDAQPKLVLNDLAANGIYTEEYGGDIQVVQVSGLTGLNMDKLEEEIITLAEVLDLKAEFSPAGGAGVEGHVIESQVKKGAGNVATVLVTRGTLKNGSILVAGQTWCKVKSLKNEFDQPVKLATPATPVEVYGWKELPESGDLVLEVKKEAKAKSVCEYRIQRAKDEQKFNDLENINKSRMQQKQQLEREEKLKELLKYGLSKEDLKQKELELFGSPEDEASADGKTKEVPFIIKADVSGSAEAIVESIGGIGNEEVKPVILYEEVNAPNESDIDRAEAAGATIVCFNVNVSKDVLSNAEKRGVKIVQFTVIYHLIEEVSDILSSYLKPITETTVLGQVDIKAIFTITNPKTKKKFKIAGSKVASGVILRNSKAIVKRNELVVFKGELNGIKQGKEDVEEVRKGSECGVQFKNWEDFQENDVVEVYEEKEVPRHL